MKRKLALLTTIAAMAALNATGVPILVDEWLGNSGAANELADVTQAIEDYNTATDPDLPELSETTNINLQSDNTGFIQGGNAQEIVWTAPATYDYYYVMTKWGKGKDGLFDHALHYVLAGETLTYNPGGDGPPEGLSHVSIWAGDDSTSVPDGGLTLTLLGLGAAGVAGLARRR